MRRLRKAGDVCPGEERGGSRSLGSEMWHYIKCELCNRGVARHRQLSPEPAATTGLSLRQESGVQEPLELGFVRKALEAPVCESNELVEEINQWFLKTILGEGVSLTKLFF